MKTRPIQRRVSRAFTLIEMLLVAALLALAAGLIAPRMNRAYRGLELRAAAREIAMAIEAAGELAVRERVETRFVANAEGDAYWIEIDDASSAQPDMEAVQVGVMAELRALPNGMRIEVGTANGSESKRHLSLLPDGSRSGGWIELTDRRERKRWIDAGRSLGGARILTERPEERRA